MSPTRKVALFVLVLETPADKRPGFLHAVCAGDHNLRARFGALLVARDEPDGLTHQMLLVAARALAAYSAGDFDRASFGCAAGR
jgi:hypothetical protein